MSVDTAMKHVRDAEAHERAGDPAQALASARLAYEASGHDPQVRRLLARLLLATGQPAAAHGHLLKLWTPGDLDAQIKLVEALRSQVDRADDPELETDILRCLDFPNIDAQRLARVAGARLRRKHTGAPDLDALAADPFLLRLMSAIYFADPEIERLLTAGRRMLLLEVASTGGIAPGRLELIAAVAMQAACNEYVWFGEEDEARLVEGFLELQPRLVEAGDTDGLLAVSLVAAMYLTLDEMPAAPVLRTVPPEDWPDAIRPLIERTLLHPETERALAAELPALSPIVDQTSRAVRDMYEANPYPRWLTAGHRAPVDFWDDLGAALPFAEPINPPDGRPAEVLVAGCGTGRQPITIALGYKDATVTAIDLSLSSLAYGKRMAAKMGADAIDFRHGDLLELPRLERRFPIIYSSGVLHHMKDPVAGWTALVEMLEPDGVMNIGLYSERARGPIVEARRVVAEQGLGDDPDSIRRFRREVLAGRFGDRFDTLTRMNDFFCVSGVRDLVFHVHEHRYTPAQIDEIRRELGLEFLGFSGLPGVVVEAYRKSFPGDATLTDLGQWERFEAANPAVFLGMYNMWFRRAV